MRRTLAVLLFMATAFLVAMPGVVAVVTMGKLESHAAINGPHAPWADVFFRYATHLGDGLVVVAVALALLLLKDLRSFLMMALACGLSAIVVQALKRLVFDGMHRPGMFREGLGGVSWVEGVELHLHFSFPSGHATAAFSMCLALAAILGRPGWAVVLALVAAVLAFSRVYLSQHFMEDVLAGGALGTLIAAAVYSWLYRGPFAGSAWLDRRAMARGGV